MCSEIWTKPRKLLLTVVHSSSGFEAVIYCAVRGSCSSNMSQKLSRMQAQPVRKQEPVIRLARKQGPQFDNPKQLTPANSHVSLDEVPEFQIKPQHSWLDFDLVRLSTAAPCLDFWPTELELIEVILSHDVYGNLLWSNRKLICQCSPKPWKIDG